MTTEERNEQAQNALAGLSRAVEGAVDKAHAEAPTAARREIRRWWPWVVIANAVVSGTLAVLVYTLFGISGQQAAADERQAAATERLALCQAAYSNGFADALNARTAANAEAQTALDELMRTVGEVLDTGQRGDGSQLSAAVDDYLAKRAEAKQTQQENPYPDPPRDACKE